MNRLNTRIGKLEQQNAPEDTIDAITWTFVAAGPDGPRRTGATTTFLGVELPQVHQGAHQLSEEYDAQVNELRSRVRDLKGMPDAERQAGLDALANEINDANRLQNKA